MKTRKENLEGMALLMIVTTYSSFLLRGFQVLRVISLEPLEKT
jgi:hypothetical protein